MPPGLDLDLNAIIQDGSVVVSNAYSAIIIMLCVLVCDGEYIP